MPLVIGHEFVGDIVEVGSNVSDFHPGDVVSGEGHVVCGRCRNCMAGRRHLCAFAKGIGVDRPGAFAELIALPMTNVWHHDPAIDRDVASIFDPFGNAVHTALQFPVLGEDVAITAGPIGLMAAAVVRHAGAPRRDHRREPQPAGARDQDGRDARPRRPGVVARRRAGQARDEGGLRRRPRDERQPAALHDLLANLSHGAKVAMLGLPDEPFAVDWKTVIFDQLTLKGVYGRQMYETWYMMTVMLQSGLDISPVITHRFPAQEFEEAFAAIRTGETGKVLLHWADGA